MSHLIARTFCISVTGLCVSWVLLSGHSPLSSSLIGMPLVTNIASAVNLPTMLFALSGPPAPAEGAVLIAGAMQWLAYGFAMAWIWERLSGKRSFKNVLSKSRSSR